MTRYLVLGIAHLDRYGIDYTSPFIEDYATAFSLAESVSAKLGNRSVMSIVKNPFTDDAVSQTLTKADFEKVT